MEEKLINRLIEKQKSFFLKGKTFNVEFRIEALKKLYKIVNENQDEIANALYKDLGKSYFESFMCETGIVLSEISFMLKHIKGFAKIKKVKTPLAQFSSKSYKQPTPYGNVLIMSPWNYPFLLTLEPLVDAISAGNTAIIKPSAYSPNTSELVKNLIEKNFDEEYIAIITGGRKENTALLLQKFDMIFFTGSQNVGKEVLRKCAEHLTPAVLELGGKSPCIVEKTADIKLTAKRIVFGKFLNCGQTCVAPDYILCENAVYDKLVESLKEEITKQFGKNPLENKDYGKIINNKHFERILSLINKDKVAFGGKSNSDTLKIEPTILTEVDFEDAVMQEEIFGPLLPVIRYENYDDIFKILNGKDKPLALYIFTNNKNHANEVMEKLRFGGGCINDTIIHLATSEMGFGGVGESGMGAYHGKVGFDAFTHYKNIVDKKTFIDLPMRYQPYSKNNQKIINKFLK